MGLDTVELLMAIEEEFGLHFNDADAADCTTPRHVADYLSKRVRTSSDDPCPTQRGFYKIGNAILSSFDFRREDIAPSTKLSIIFGKPEKQSWEKLGQAIATDDLEVKASYEWYQRQADGLGDDFLTELETAYQAIS